MTSAFGRRATVSADTRGERYATQLVRDGKFVREQVFAGPGVRVLA